MIRLLRRSAPAPAPPAPIYLVSMAGHPNFGDDLIAARWLEYLAEHRPETPVWLDVREPGTAAALLRGIHPDVQTTDTVFRLIADHPIGSARPAADVVEHLGSPHYDAGLLALREAGTLHMLGGGYVNAVWPQFGLIPEVLRAAARVSGARMLATGQGLLPRIEEDFAGFDHLSVRDAGSAEALGIGLGLDDAFLGPGGRGPSADRWAGPRDAPPRVLVCVQSDAQDDGAFERIVGLVREQLAAWGLPRERVLYVEAIPGQDHPGYARLRDVVAEDGFVPFTAFWRDFRFSPEDLWLTTRFHHHLMGAAHGARGIAYAGKRGYYDVKHGSLAALGTGWEVRDAGDHEPVALEALRRPADTDPLRRAKRAEADALYRA